jgi:hypothetical protein
VDKNERTGLSKLLAEVDQEQADRPQRPQRVAEFDEVWAALGEVLETRLEDEAGGEMT